MTMNKLSVGETALVRRILIHGSMRRRFLDLGLVEGTAVTCLGRSVLGDPAAYNIRGAVIAIRDRDSIEIEVTAEGSNDG